MRQQPGVVVNTRRAERLNDFQIETLEALAKISSGEERGMMNALVELEMFTRDPRALTIDAARYLREFFVSRAAWPQADAVRRLMRDKLERDAFDVSRELVVPTKPWELRYHGDLP